MQEPFDRVRGTRWNRNITLETFSYRVAFAGRLGRLGPESAALLLKDSAVTFRANQQLELLLVSLFTPKE